MHILSRISDWKKAMSEKPPQFESQYALGVRLAGGGFGTVYSCGRVGEKTEELVVKVLDRKQRSGLRNAFRKETKLLRLITPNQHCVQMLDAFEGPRYCHIVLEQCECTVLEAIIASTKCDCIVTEQHLAHVFKCMLSGVQHLHRCNIVHRDIKPANLLLAQGHDLLQSPLVKVCDLGLAAILPARGGLSEICGTAPYMAPEMLHGKTYHGEVDLWSCGVTAYLLLLGEYPFGHSKSSLKNMEAEFSSDGFQWHPRPSFKARTGFAQPALQARKFLSSLLLRDPLLRAGCRSALNSEYIRSFTAPILPSQAAREATKLEPGPETLPVKSMLEEDDQADKSTVCGSSDDEPPVKPPVTGTSHKTPTKGLTWTSL